jgi:N-acetylneuraminate synthase
VSIKTRDRVFIIAEAGVNHNGSLPMAKELVDAAATAGADAVKFQTFKAGHLASGVAPKAGYQVRTTGASESQLEMLRRLELDAESHRELITHCGNKGIEFLSSPFDHESLDLLALTLDLRLLKLPSGEITNAPLLLKAARTGKPVILSTGMATLSDIETALGILAFGYTDREGTPGEASFRAAYASPAGEKALRERVTLLHCTTEYPAPFAEVHLRAMATLAAAFGLPVGLSDHTTGIAVPIAAAALGAVVLEKHFTLNRNLPGPDHMASLEPDELREMVTSVRHVEQALGSPRKQPSPAELGNAAVARKSLVAARAIRIGELFSVDNLEVKRPGTGISPLRYWELLGVKAGRNYAADEVIEL